VAQKGKGSLSNATLVDLFIAEQGEYGKSWYT
jgi:hypothetical protein